MRLLARIVPYYHFFSTFLADNMFFFQKTGKNAQNHNYYRSKKSKKYTIVRRKNAGIHQKISQKHRYQGQKAPPQSIFTQITPCYRPHFRIFRPIINVFLRVFFIYLGIFPAYYYRIFFPLFEPIISVILIILFSLENVEVCDCQLELCHIIIFFRLFWPIICFFFRKRGKMLKITTIIGQKSRKSTRQ